jgi:hypothetical protein
VAIGLFVVKDSNYAERIGVKKLMDDVSVVSVPSKPGIRFLGEFGKLPLTALFIIIYKVLFIIKKNNND